MSKISETGWGMTTNTAKYVQKGKRRAVQVVIETGIRDKRAVKVLLHKVLRAASRAEHEVCCLSWLGIDEELKLMGEIQDWLKVKKKP